MRKFTVSTLIVMLTFSLFFAGFAYAADGNTWLNTSQIDKGIISINYNVETGAKIKLLIAKGTQQYSYNLSQGKQEFFPLQLGNGNYVISLVKQVSGKKYQVIEKANVALDLQDSSQVYLNSIQNISFTDQNQAIKKAKDLVKNKASDMEKITAIYNYVIGNIKYDQSLPFNLSTDYLPQIDRTFVNQKDICYGYASLFAAMLRSENIPTKLVMGNSKYVKNYHAWNEVFVDGKWVVIDTTVDAGWKGTSTAFEMIKDTGKYTAVKQY